LDLALVLDDSGSMGTSSFGQTRLLWQRQAATALVNSLPAGSSSVAVVEFGSSATTLIGLTPVSTGLVSITTAINSVNGNQGSTNIPAGISTASGVLTGAGHTSGRTQMMVVISDGVSSGSPGENADTAIAAGVDQIHSVGIPGHDPTTMRRIVDGANDVYDAGGDDHGIYTSFTTQADLNNLIGIFNGTAGNLVGLANVSVTLPDGTILPSVPTDGLGNFALTGGNSWSMLEGANVFTVVATATDQSTATATLTLYGVRQSVPDGGTTLMLLGLSLGAVSFAKRKFL
jgi:hypothetical protein